MPLAAAKGRRTPAGLALPANGGAGWQATAGDAAAPLPAARPTSVAFRSGTEKYHAFRIPAVVRNREATAPSNSVTARSVCSTRPE
ncbi:hypothetical protein [Actinacidiphila sp. bgisy160]|uniref:hypothetical protein n=1 Tax=Actinacidiphila sp. bgisy160 TaxID=3413796 RepID=UPI003D75D9E7